MGHLLSVISTPFKHDLHRHPPQLWQCLTLNFKDRLVERIIPTAEILDLNIIGIMFSTIEVLEMLDS